MEQDYYGTKHITAWPEEKDGVAGYGVRYHPDDYTSWSPRDVFDKAYQPTTMMSFGHALVAMKDGHFVNRQANSSGSAIAYHERTSSILHVSGKKCDFTQEDILANDWYICSMKKIV